VNSSQFSPHDHISNCATQNDDEAAQVRAIFGLYLELGGLLPVVEELARRGWTNKRWTNRQGRAAGGEPFTRTSLYRLLTNVAHAGKVRYKGEVHVGEHPPILDAQLFQQVQALLRQNKVSGGAEVRNAFGFVLKGLLRCVPCQCAMTPTHTSRNGTKRYRYYVCSKATKHGRKTCPSPSVPAAQIERFVIERIRCIGSDPVLRQQVFAEAVRQDEDQLAELEAKRRALEKDLARWHAQLRTHTRERDAAETDGVTLGFLADLQARIGTAEQQLVRLKEEMHALRRRRLNEEEVAAALEQFGPVWESLTPREQARVVQLVVAKVEYDGAAGKVAITFHPPGIKTLADELAAQTERKEIRA
jgi:site-specific DNA recombinase